MSPADAATVRLSIPADARFFRPVRLAVGGLATMVGFDVEAIEDLRIGVDELCAALAEGGDGTDLEIEVRTVPGQLLRIEGSTAKGAEPLDEDRFGFSRRILSVVADDFAYAPDGDRVRCWLERSPQSDDDRSDQPSAT